MKNKSFIYDVIKKNIIYQSFFYKFQELDHNYQQIKMVENLLHVQIHVRVPKEIQLQSINIIYRNFLNKKTIIKLK